MANMKLDRIISSLFVLGTLGMILAACSVNDKATSVQPPPSSTLALATKSGLLGTATPMPIGAMMTSVPASPGAGKPLPIGASGGAPYSSTSVAERTGAPITGDSSASTPIGYDTTSVVVLPSSTALPSPTMTHDDASGDSTLAAPSTLAPVPQQSQLKAGEIDDNVLWDDYLQYRTQHRDIVAHNVDISERYIISVTNDSGAPVLGAHVRIYGKQALLSDTYTYANGKTLFFPKAISGTDGVTQFDVQIDRGGASNKFVLTRSQQTEWRVTLPHQTQFASNTDQRVKLDVLFLLDTTGSMGDELAQLQDNILSISGQLGKLPGTPDVHYGMVAYRDRGDEYITKIFPFTTDVQKFQTDLKSLSAGGGGDEPESLNAGLHDAIHGVDWRGDDTIKLIFLVSDAPPHLDYPDDFDYAVEMQQAAAQGIKIYSLAASGLNPQGEYIFRQLAEYTMGHFIFITYAQPGQPGQPGTGGKPGDNTNLNVPKSDYQVELLDQLVLRLMRQEVLLVVNPPTQ
jgi:uncharacterized protein YegL